MQVNRLKGVVERYVGEVAGADRWETIYDPKIDGITQLEFLVSEIKREERERFAAKMAKFATDVC
jgi:hypothetical protein